ncbi:MAG TPA: hypothetical protein VHV55_05530 [Pirellulales bacterium]|jgi:hypothetical protein|nr:hypothetical protein [Pirellulales bacterium]
MSTADQPTEPKQKSALTRVLIVICGLTAMVFGGLQMYRGVTEIAGAGDEPQYQQAIKESNDAIVGANQLSQDTQPVFLELLNDVDKLGLDDVRRQKQAAADQLIEQFGKAAAQFRLAAQKLDEAAGHHVKPEFKPYFVDKSQGYRHFADACDANQQIVRLVVDKSITKLDALLPKIQALAARRDAAEKAGVDAAAQADAVAKKLNVPTQ